DFYWFTEKNNYIFIAAVDCTGHGIPGAFMSIIGINLLNSIVNEDISDPSIILNMMNKKVILTLKKTLDSGHLKDGMDMSLSVIDKNRKTINFSSAYNPVYIIRNDNIIQFKGERKSVGNDFDFNSFSTFSVKIREDDVVYLFSDGYTDQFGGTEQKKFKFRRFRFVLLSIYQLPPEKQKEKLKTTFEKWMLDNEQVDDILIIGFKPMSFIK
ncbi:MAG: SpoIIE family protein phosphatase, partial [Bacteroidota bacterium]|nr:SpoIIE family protein phosphatase [Bacteroidota bacterium]